MYLFIDLFMYFGHWKNKRSMWNMSLTPKLKKQFCLQKLGQERNEWAQKLLKPDFWGDCGVMSSRKTTSLRFGVQMMEYSNIRKKRRKMGAQDLARVWVETWNPWGEQRERDLTTEEGDGNGTFSLSLGSRHGTSSSNLETHSDYWQPKRLVWRYTSVEQSSRCSGLK